MAIMLDNTRLSPKVQKIVTKPGTSTATIAVALSKNSFKAKPVTVQAKTAPVKTVIPLELSGGVLASNVMIKGTTGATVKAVVPALTTAQKTAITGAMATKYGQAVVSSPPNQAMIAKLRTIAVLTQIKKSGLELAPKGTTEYLYNAETQTATFRDAVNSLLGQQEQWVAKQTEYQNLLSARETELAKGTQELGNVKGQLNLLTTDYLALQERYNELLANPPEKPGTDILGGFGDFIAKYGLWIVLGVGAIILLPSVMRIFERR